MSDWLIDSLMPKHEVHLVAGVTGAGKTTWLFHTLLEWEQKLPVLGLPSHPVPWVYVPADRSIASAWRTMDAMGISHQAIQMIPAHGADHKTWPQIMAAVASTGAELAVIEAFGSFAGSSNNHHEVNEFMHQACAYTPPSSQFPNGLTILGVMESPKTKPGERYSYPRQRISGAATWGHMADLILLIEHVDITKSGDPRRVLHVCPRIGQDREIQGGFLANHHLVFP